MSYVSAITIVSTLTCTFSILRHTCEREPPTSIIRHSVPESLPAAVSSSKMYSATPTVFSLALRTSSIEDKSGKH